VSNPKTIQPLVLEDDEDRVSPSNRREVFLEFPFPEIRPLISPSPVTSVFPLLVCADAKAPIQTGLLEIPSAFFDSPHPGSPSMLLFSYTVSLPSFTNICFLEDRSVVKPLDSPSGKAGQGFCFFSFEPLYSLTLISSGLGLSFLLIPQPFDGGRRSVSSTS